MQAPLDHEILYNALRNIESKSVKEVKSELFRVSLDIFRLVKVSLFSGGTKPSLDQRSVSTLLAVSLSAFRPVC